MDKSMLRKALADNSDPIPGFMLREIAQWTLLDFNSQDKLQQYLLDKLSVGNSAFVLAKTLKLLKHVIETGHPDFQKSMQRHSDKLKQFSSYRGKSDPQYGDQLNEKVRQTAREAVEACFTARKTKATGQFEGHGSDDTSGWGSTGGAGGFSTGGKVGSVASGHPNMADMPTTNKWKEHMETANKPKPSMLEKVKDELKKSVHTRLGTWEDAPKTGKDLILQGNSESSFKPVQLDHDFDDFGAGKKGANAPMYSGLADDAAPKWKFGQDDTLTQEEEVRKITPAQREVEKITAFKNVPQRVDLQTFMKNLKGLRDSEQADWEGIAAALDEKLSSKLPWQQRLNALTCIEHIVKMSTDDDTVKSYFLENPEDVHRNVHVVQSTLQDKAKKVLRLLGISETSTQAPQAAEQMKIATASGTVAWAASVNTGGDGGADELDFSKMQMKARDHKDPTAMKTKLTKKRATASTSQQQQQGAWGGDDSWGGNGSPTPAQGAPQPARQQQQAPPQQDPMGGIWGNQGSRPSQQPSQPASANFLDDMMGGSSAPRAQPAGPPKRMGASASVDDIFGDDANSVNSRTSAPSQGPASNAGGPPIQFVPPQGGLWGNGQQQQQQAAPQGTPIPDSTPAPAKAPANLIPLEKLMDMQQQTMKMQQMYNDMLSKGADKDDPKMSQIQQQIQQQMTFIMTMMAQHKAAMSGQQPQQQQQPRKPADAFDFVQQEMRKDMAP